jgi:hypothetical protein
MESSHIVNIFQRIKDAICKLKFTDLSDDLHTFINEYNAIANDIIGGLDASVKQTRSVAIKAFKMYASETIDNGLIENDDVKACIIKIDKYLKTNTIKEAVSPSEPKSPTQRHKCLKCNETDPKYFNRKITECIQCMSIVIYEKRKPVIEYGRERNNKAKLEYGACKDCGLTVNPENTIAFDWDHREPDKKIANIARMHSKKDDAFIKEIAKCDLVCKNCHALRTHNQRAKKALRKKPNMKEKELLNKKA